MSSYRTGTHYQFLSKASFDDLADRVARMEAAVAATQAKLTPPEPRPELMYVDDVPADGTREIRWWLSASAKWGPWVRVVRDTQSDVGRRTFDAHDPTARVSHYLLTLARDECVQVRPVMDPQTGDMLGDVA